MNTTNINQIVLFFILNSIFYKIKKLMKIYLIFIEAIKLE